MSNYIVIDEPIPLEKFQAENNAIALLHTDKVPIHLGLIAQGMYHSLTIKGYDQKSWETLYQLIVKKRIKTLFISLKNVRFDHEDISFFFNYYTLNTPEVTCLTPLRSLISHTLKKEIKARVIFELIEQLENLQHINQYFAFPQQASITLKKYSHFEVMKHIKNLKA